ncbi:MAG: hypothetical protein N4A45_12225 [Flavobacteriales bacterium]|jgi:hypothetical protein|nr:hypothetical protein [Flavobacteriales bacterium]
MEDKKIDHSKKERVHSVDDRPLQRNAAKIPPRKPTKKTDIKSKK